jgi:methionyl-tRNA formyltransferase
MSAPRSILFLGTSAFAVPALKHLAADDRFRVIAVITQPDRPAGRKQILTPPPVKEAARKLQLPVLQPENLNRDAEELKLEQPDFLVVVSYGQILSQKTLNLPRLAPVNVHASLLPRWRGASPIQHAILADDQATGVTVQRMVRELDAGPILGQALTTVEPRETFATLHDRLADAGARLLAETLAAPLRDTPQNEADATFCTKLSREDGFVDPATMTAEDIDRTVRGLNPWPGVTVTIDGQPLKLLETELSASKQSFPLPCANNSTLFLVTIQPAGKKPMTGTEWARGRQKP